MVSPAGMQPDYSHYGYGQQQGMVSPAGMQPDYSHYGYGQQQGMVSPAGMQPDYSHYGYGQQQEMVSPAGMQPDYSHYGYGQQQGMLSPAGMQPDYSHYGYGQQGMVSPMAVDPYQGQGSPYGYPVANLSAMQQQYGYGGNNNAVLGTNAAPVKDDCGCGSRGEAFQEESYSDGYISPPKKEVKVKAKPKKKTSVKTVVSRSSNSGKRSSKPWINR